MSTKLDIFSYHRSRQLLLHNNERRWCCPRICTSQVGKQEEEQHLMMMEEGGSTNGRWWWVMSSPGFFFLCVHVYISGGGEGATVVVVVVVVGVLLLLVILRAASMQIQICWFFVFLPGFVRWSKCVFAVNKFCRNFWGLNFHFLMRRTCISQRTFCIYLKAPRKLASLVLLNDKHR